jgi:4-amino-4-deoxy-L-arabinose transferase-like glycosyltransferase
MPSWLVAALPAAAAVLGIVTLRYWLAAHMDFETDEAYYWMWSRSLAASYYDHPPMVAYLIRLGTSLFSDSIIGIRSMALLAMIGASVLLYFLAVVLFDDRRVALIAAFWFNMTPHTTFFSVVMFPDTPAILFWVLSCVAAALIWRTGRGQWWYLLGFAAGLLLLSKYTGVFLLSGIAAWLVASKELRFWLKRHEPYLAAAIALSLFSPVLWWNGEHGWVSFIKQFGRAFEASADAGVGNVAGYLGIQAAFVSPLIFVFLVAGLGIATWRGVLRQEANWLLLALSGAPMLLYFAVHALSAEVLAQWPSAAYPTGILAAVAAFALPASRRERSAVIPYGLAVAPWLGLIFTLTLIAQLTVRPLTMAVMHDPLNRFFGWRQLAFDTRAIMRSHQAGYIATNEHSIGATLQFYLRNAAVFQTAEPVRYEFGPPLDQALLLGTTGIYLAVSPDDDLARLKVHFNKVELISTIWRNRDGDPIEPYRVYALKGYRGGMPF